MKNPFSIPAKDKKESENRLTVSMVEDCFRSAENWTDIRQIMVNVNYFVGNQWIGWNRGERRIQVLPLEPGYERVTLNKIRPRIMTLLSKHTRNKLKFNVIPASKEQQDIDTAKAADKFLHFMWQELDFSEKTRDIFLNMLVKKRCWVKTWFDPDAGDDITPTEGDPGYEEWLEGDRKPIRTGVIRARVCDPLTIFADPAATTEEEIRWILERKATDVDEIFETYGIRVEPDANLDYLNAYDITRIGGDGIGAYETTRKKNMALLYELWVKPCQKFPKGARIVVAGGKELDYTEEAGELPYVLFGYIPIPGSLLYDAIVTDMIPVQRSINVKRSMIATHAKRLGNSMWLNPIGSNVDEEELTNETGGIIHYNPVSGAKPERVEAPNIPNFYDRDLAQDAVDLDDMSGAREVSQGRMPAGLDTLGGLQIMVEQENEKLTVASQNYERGMKKVMQRILRLIKNHYTEERQVRILGEDNEIELISFNGADLTGYEDINVIQGSSLPEMRAAQESRIMLMWNSGAIVKKDGTPDTAKLLRLMGMGDSTELFEEYALDENNAKMEQRTFEEMAKDPQAILVARQYFAQYGATMKVLEKAQVPPDQWKSMLPPPPPGTPQVWDSDDHEVHLNLHNIFRKTSRYRELPPEIRMLVDMHVLEHIEQLQAPMKEQQQAAQAAMEQKSQEAEASRQHEAEIKRLEQEAGFQRDLLKAETELAKTAMKGGVI